MMSDFRTLVVSVARSIQQAIGANPDVRETVHRHPRLFAFLKNRIDRRRFSGLPLTFLAIAFFYTLAVLLGVAEDVLTSDPIVAVDTGIAHLLYAFRVPVLVHVFFWITLLGKWPLVMAAVVAVSILLWLWQKRSYIGPLWITVLGTELFVVLGKLAFHRARPGGVLPVYNEPSFSFPSNHAALAVAFYGFLTYMLMRHGQTWQEKVNVLFGGMLVVLLIGFSRLYLGVHFLSDVWSGYLMGLLWLIIGISIAELSAASARPRVSARD